MKGWQKIDDGWYRHESGAVVQRWGNYNALHLKTGWFAWRPKDKDDEGKPFRRMREACEWALMEYA